MVISMTSNPLITVIIPTYNIMEYLPRCVHSVTAQTYRNLEIILVDDGSTDGTGELCDKLGLEDGRIRVFHKENGGSSSARNLGLKEAAGEYVGFVDSDDYIEPDMYERLLKGIEDYSVTVSQIGRDEIDEQGKRLSNICEPPKEPEIWDSKGFFRELLMHKGDCSFCTKLIRRDLFWKNPFPEQKLNEDFRLLVQMLPEIGKLVSLPGQAYHVFYRIGSNSRKKDRETFSRVFADSVENADMAEKMAAEQYPELSETAFRFGVFQRLEYMLHIPISQMKKDNGMYREVVRYLRKNWFMSMRNPILTKKNKLYHTLLAIAPREIRMLHARLKGKRL